MTAAVRYLEDRRPTLFGKLLCRLCPLRRKVIRANLRRVFGAALGADGIEKIYQLFGDHFWRSIAENMALARLSEAEIRRRVRIEGEPLVREAALAGRGVLLLTGHLGNFEFCPVAAMSRFPEFRGRFHIVRKPIVNKALERLLFRRFYAAGLDVIPKKNSLGRVLEVLSRNDAVVFIMDQYANPAADGVVVDFFGTPAGTFKSLALVARLSGAPVVPVSSWRERDGMQVMRFRDPLRWVECEDPDREIAVNTRRYNETLEAMILEHPDQWWWPHNRWKTK